MTEFKFIVFILFLGFVVVTMLYPLFRRHYIETLIMTEVYLVCATVATIYLIVPIMNWWINF